MEYAVVILIVVLVSISLVSRASGKKDMPLGTARPVLQSPLRVPLVLRNDQTGRGHFGAPRGSRKHNGIDFVCPPDLPVYAPISGTIRPVQVYTRDPLWKGIAIKAGTTEVKIFYVSPLRSLPKSIRQGELVGMAQNRAAATPGMINHIHVEVWLNGKAVDPGPFFNYKK